VCGKDGLDEITTTTQTIISEFHNGILNTYEIALEHFGFKKARAEDLLGGNISDNVQIMLEVLNGKPGSKRDIVLLNAAAGLYVSDKVKSIKEGIGLASESIDSGRALKKLALLKEYSRRTNS
jgi:anthranilate phosphoribosyltransferase